MPGHQDDFKRVDFESKKKKKKVSHRICTNSPLSDALLDNLFYAVR